MTTANRMNNVAVEQIAAFGQHIQADKTNARRTQVVEGEWLLREGGPQFRSNFERAFGLGEAPTIEEVRVTLYVVSPAPVEKIREAEELALQRCPVVFTLRNPIKLTPEIEISQG